MDKEKVIKGLEIQLDDLQKYADSDEMLTLTQEQAKEIVALLKKQEARDECLKRKCVICPHCENCDVDENGLLKEHEDGLKHYDDGSAEPCFKGNN